MNKKNNRKGFTIVELVIVIAVIAILATVLVPTFGNVIEKANQSKAVSAAKNAHTLYVSEVDYAKGETPIETLYYVSNNIIVKVVDGNAALVDALPTDDCYEQLNDNGTLTHKAAGTTKDCTVDGCTNKAS